MFRTLTETLKQWRNDAARKPLLIRGPRQVGKSYLVEEFARSEFDNYVIVNFELSPEFIACFDTLDPTRILMAIEAATGQPITPGETLLFLDEIQICPKAIQSLRYFKEKRSNLHVIGAGSFLEFVINDETFQYPVGRVQSLYLTPCSFKEFLLADGQEKALNYLNNVSLTEKINPAVHEMLLRKCREYFVVGGMPEVMQAYFEAKSYLALETIHATLLEYYQRDFAKYHAKLNTTALEKIFIKAPSLMAKHFKYVDIDPEIPARQQRPALEALIKAGIIAPVYQTSANTLPLKAGINEKKFKLLCLDIGLAQHALGIPMGMRLQEVLALSNRGNLAEQFVGQELMAYAPNYSTHDLFYWARDKRGSQAEVDYVIQHEGIIYPIEVKAGKTGKLKSMQIFLKEQNLSLGIRISELPFALENNILSIPFYMLFELPRLLSTYQARRNTV